MQGFNPDTGAVVRTIGEKGTEKGQVVSPFGVCCSADGVLFVTEEGNNRIQAFPLVQEKAVA